MNNLVSAAIDHADEQGVHSVISHKFRGTSSKLCPLQQDHFLPYFVSSRRNVAEQLQVSRNDFRTTNDFSGEHTPRLVLLVSVSVRVQVWLHETMCLRCPGSCTI